MTSASHELVFDERLLPPTLSALRRILRSIGPHKTIVLLKAFPDQRGLSLPKADKLLAQIRNKTIRAEQDTKSLTVQALEYRLTARQVQNIRRGSDPEIAPDPQSDLFGEPDDGR